MRPFQLAEIQFAAYPSAGRAFAVNYLPLLRRLPLAVCPSFLRQIQTLDTSFPAEAGSLAWQCDSLQAIPEYRYSALIAALASLSLPAQLEAMNWVQSPAAFVTELTAFLWSSGQMNRFRAGTDALFAAVPARNDDTQRLALVILGQGAQVDAAKTLRKLRSKGVLLNAMKTDTALADMRQMMGKRAAAAPEPYAHWYVDGAALSTAIAGSSPHLISVSYDELRGVREQVLGRMQAMISNGGGGAEEMRTRLTGISLREAGTQLITTDPVLQRFYTELFTESSGPQIFSTSFVQWTGRELARRAKPRTMLLRYAPRAIHRDMNEMFAAASASSLDPQGSFRDAEMGAYYAWIEMNRITSPGKLTFVAWIEDQSLAVIVGANAPSGTVCDTPMTLNEALQNFS